MKHSESIKPISYIKSHAADVIEKMNKDQKPLIITQNGEAKVILQDLKRYENEQEALKMLKVIAQGQAEIENGEVVSAKKAFQSIRKKASKNSAA